MEYKRDKRTIKIALVSSMSKWFDKASISLNLKIDITLPMLFAITNHFFQTFIKKRTVNWYLRHSHTQTLTKVDQTIKKGQLERKKDPNEKSSNNKEAEKMQIYLKTEQSKRLNCRYFFVAFIVQCHSTLVFWSFALL